MATRCDSGHAHAGGSRLEVDKPHQDSSAPADVTIIDQGRFAFLEFDDKDETDDRPVINGVHVVQALPSSLAGRAEVFSDLDASLQVAPILSSKLLQFSLKLRPGGAGCYEMVAWGCSAQTPNLPSASASRLKS